MGNKGLRKLGHNGEGFTLDGVQMTHITGLRYETFKDENGDFKSILNVKCLETDDKGNLKLDFIDGELEFIENSYEFEVDDSELYRAGSDLDTYN